jgi:hypothetical protein
MINTNINTNTNTKQIIVDITVANCQIRGAKPIIQNDPMPTFGVEKIVWWNTIRNIDRLNNRIYGTLKGNALKRAKQVVNA